MNDHTEMTVSGPSFEELTLEQMHSIQGSGDVQAETTLVCVMARTSKTSAVGGVVLGIGTGVTIVLTIRKC